MAYLTGYQYYENSGTAPTNQNWGSYQYVSLEDVVKGAQSNGIITYVSNANQNIKQIMNNVDFIENIGKEYYKDSTESLVFHILENNNQNI